MPYHAYVVYAEYKQLIYRQATFLILVVGVLKKNLQLVDSENGRQIYYSPEKKGYYVFCDDFNWNLPGMNVPGIIDVISFDKFFKINKLKYK